MTHPVVLRRRAERQDRLDRAGAYATALAGRLPALRSVVVFGSVARGDWNLWSDIDVLVVADELPADPLARLDLTLLPGHEGIAPVVWTPAELAGRPRHDPIATEVRAVGVVVYGE